MTTMTTTTTIDRIDVRARFIGEVRGCGLRGGTTGRRGEVWGGGFRERGVNLAEGRSRDHGHP
jgi:hypothetical protein